MVPRSDLLAAQAEAKKGKEDYQTMADTISRLQKQLNEARLESAQLHADAGSLVSRASYEAIKKQLEESETAAKDEKQKLSSAIQALNERLSDLEDERSKLILSMQASPFLPTLSPHPALSDESETGHGSSSRAVRSKVSIPKFRVCAPPACCGPASGCSLTGALTHTHDATATECGVNPGGN